MSVVFVVLSGLLLLVGCCACIVPVLPGPLVAFCGLLLMNLTPYAPSAGALVAFGLLTALASVLDNVVPALGAKRCKCSKWGVWGCVLGTFIGVFFFPAGLLLGPFLGAFLLELAHSRNAGQALKGGLGAFLGFLTGVALKLLTCLGMAAWYVRLLVSGPA